MTAALLETRQLRLAVPGRVLIDDFTCAVRAGEVVALLGGNGAGKSLLLRTLAGLRAATAGSVLLGGRDIHTLARRDIATRLGFLPQDPDATPQGLLAESVLLGRFAHLGFWQTTDVDDAQRVSQALGDVGLGTLAQRELGTLSGGEQRRAAIARLLVQAPSIYLLDEPTNHLDPAQQLGVLERLRTLARAGAAVIASLHDPNLALRY
ncbi:MAG: ABC transporter ATP-binding protein, partial [Pseudomonadota bacterium]